KALAPGLDLQSLDARHREIAARHKRDSEALAAARKAAERGLEVRRTELAHNGFTGLLARVPGLSHLFESVIAERRREIEQSHAAAKRAEATTYRAELDALKRAYTALIDRHSRA